MTARISAIRTIFHSFREEGNDLLRGAAGGIIFGTPLLFTMEMWFHGLSFAPSHLLGTLVFIAAVNLIFCYASGLRKKNDGHSVRGALADTITAMGLGVIVATIILWLIGRLHPADGIEAMTGKILLEAGAVSIGITFTNSKFPRQKKKEKETQKKKGDFFESADLSPAQHQARADLENFAAAIGGAVVFSFNIAPTEEIVMIAAGLKPYALLILLIAELAFCYMILYASDFKEKKIYKDSLLQTPAAEVAITVAASLLVSGLLLILVGEDETFSSMTNFIASIITLGFPAVIGGAAGRLVV